MELSDRVAPITGGSASERPSPRNWPAEAPTWRSSIDPRGPKRRKLAGTVRGLGRRALVLQADLADVTAAERVIELRRRPWPPGYPGHYGVPVSAEAVRRAGRRRLGGSNGGRPARRMAVARARLSRHMRRRARRAHHQSFGLGCARRAGPATRDILRTMPEAGVIALTEALALELAPDQILVNAVAPGPIVAPETISDEEFAQVERATPLGRWGRRDRDCENRPRAGGKRFHYRRDDPCRRRSTRQMKTNKSPRLKSQGSSS